MKLQRARKKRGEDAEGEEFSNGGLSSLVIRSAMSSVKTPLPAEGVEIKQGLFAFLLASVFHRVKSLDSAMQ